MKTDKTSNRKDTNSFDNSSILDFYADSVKILAENDSENVFSNSGPEHAAIVMGNMFRFSNERILMFSGNFKGTVSDDIFYCTELEKFLERGGKISIIFEEQPNGSSKALEILKKFPNKVNISLLDSKDFDDVPHFLTADGKRFRLEEDKENYKAICSFKSNMARTLELIHLHLTGRSKPVSFS